MKILEKGLSKEEFESYCQNKANELEGETYFGQQDEKVPFCGDLQRKHIYSEDNEEQIVILYKSYLSENETETLYAIYDTID